MLEAAAEALGLILEPARLAVLCSGVLIGLGLGVIPGLGGIVGLALLLPFTFTMDPYTAFAFLLGMAAVTTTSDTIPAVLFGVPGTVGSAATVLDGNPMAKKGEAGRAFGAAYTASLIGGILGAVLLAVSIPVLRPVILYLGSPELLAISILGLSMVAALSRGTPLRGLAMAGFGVLLAMVGADPQSGTPRWTLDSIYLLDGLELVPITLGLFALPELADMFISRRSIAAGARPDVGAGRWLGVKDALRHRWLVFRVATIGAGLGAIPGLGAAVIDWIAYGHAARTEKGARNTFGTGDVRGVLASEGANNAKEGGALVPTIAFGIPGSASMAILLGAFLIHGLQPGPQMLSANLDVTYTMVWSIALANIVGAGLCFAFSNQFAHVATIRPTIIVPLILSIVAIGAYQASQQWGDLYMLLMFGLIGWVMKRLNWPRPPLLLGFVLGGIIEQFMFISTMRYGWEWLARPVVIIVLALAVVGFLRPLMQEMQARRSAKTTPRDWSRPRIDAGAVFYGFLLVFLALLFAASLGWSASEARLAPTMVITVVFAALVASLIHHLYRRDEAVRDGDRPQLDLTANYSELALGTLVSRAARFLGWFGLLLVLIWLTGVLPALAVFLVAHMRLAGGERWPMVLMTSAAAVGAAYLLFDQLLAVVWPATVLGRAFPSLAAVIPSL